MQGQKSQRKTPPWGVAIVLLVIVLLTIESSSRALVTLHSEISRAKPPQAQPEATPSRELGWQRAPNFEGRLSFDNGDHIRKHDAHGFLAYDTAQLKDTSKPRILAIGDSNTYGWGVAPEATWVEVLDRALPAASVINLGWLGYSSYQGYQMLLKYGDALKPQLIIVSFNYNDRRYIYDHNIDSAEKFARNFDAIRTSNEYEWLQHIYTVRLLRSMMIRAGLLKHELPAGTTDVRHLEARVPPQEYRENLRKFAEYGRAHNVPVVFLLLKDNPYFTRQIRRGIEYREAGDSERAARAFTQGLTNRVSGTLSRKYLALMYQNMGETEKADAIGRIDRQLEPIDGLTPIYLDTEYNSIMLEVGKEYGVTVVNAGPTLHADTKVYIDICHPDEVGHARIAELVLNAIKVVAPALARPTAGRASERAR